MSLAFLFPYLMLNMFRMLIYPSSWVCDLCVELLHGFYCSGTMHVGVTLWSGWGGAVSLCRLKQCFSLHKDTTPPQPSHTVTPTHIEPEQFDTWNKSTIIRKLLKMDVLTFETCWAVNSEKIKQVISSWSIFIKKYNVIENTTNLNVLCFVRHCIYYNKTFSTTSRKTQTLST
jgi:hypothetical protein